MVIPAPALGCWTVGRICAPAAGLPLLAGATCPAAAGVSPPCGLGNGLAPINRCAT